MHVPSEVLPSSPEKAAAGPENRETSQQPAQMQPIAPAPSMPTLPAPTVQPPVVHEEPAAQIGPTVAADEDVIEKEWVDKAKKLIAQTKDDPYTQEKEVSKLQADYLKKRYGKEVKLSSE